MIPQNTGSRILKHGSAWLIMILICLASAYGQDSRPPADTAPAFRPSADYPVGPGDLLSVRVLGVTQFDRSTRVSNSGKMSVPYVGVLQVAGMTAFQIENLIAKEIKEKQILTEPWVRVQVAEYNAQPVFIMGEVQTPGQFMINGEMRLLDVISKAGGIRPTAADDAYVIRSRVSAPDPNSGGKDPEDSKLPGEVVPISDAQGVAKRITININQLTEGSKPELNLPLQGGDIVYIPTAQPKVIYIIGEVAYAGAYVLPRDFSEITATRALAYAGGPRRRSAKTSKAVVVRRNSDGTIKPMEFDIAESIKGHKEDIQMQPDDIIFVPRSWGKMTGYKMLDMIAHMTHQFVIF
jgi:polysaccharide biosynthesis/export protein